jgi:hypothetical protein
MARKAFCREIGLRDGTLEWPQTGTISMSMIKKLLTATILASAVAFAMPTATMAFDSEHKEEWKNINILFVPWS